MGYHWTRKEWGEIPPQAWHRPLPPQPIAIHLGHLPISNIPCPACRRPLSQALIDDGETHHITCYPTHQAQP